ncbi:MAG TPA: serine/threonine-protein kinase [Gemmatimonadales bacterium]|nr:serine/threonine-protein kinase [Gemmatimonadales bacterium]
MDRDPSPTFLALQATLAGRYALERELGRGGMGIVYLARDLALDRPVAIKLLAPALARVPAQRARFLREARTAARLSHPNIVPIHAVEEQGDAVLFVMGYVEGETLAQRIARAGPLSAEQAIPLLQEVAWALAYAHQHGVIHRDIKPDNILLERDSGRALVSDFGIAQVDGPEGGAAGEVLGTLRYMSPEQLAGRPLDGRSDLYALGATALRALTGTTGADSPGLGGRLGAIVARCLAEDPAERFADGEALALALGELRGRQLVVPAAVERFVDLYKTLGTEVATYAAVIAVLGGEALALASWGNPLFPTVLIYALFVAIGLGALRFFQLVERARHLLEQGYTVSDVRNALSRSEEPAAVRFQVVTGLAPQWRRRFPRWVLAAEGVVGAGLWVLAWRWWAHASRGALVDGLLFAVLTLLPLVMLRTLFSRLLRPGKRGRWARFWWKVMEWKVFKVARLGAKGAIAASEPTELALGGRARELFDALPAELRQRFLEVPRVLERLEDQASRLREVSGADPDARLASTHAALEQVRLDLLRLRAGSGSEGELTADLDAARAVTERIAALLDARRALESPTPVSGV